MQTLAGLPPALIAAGSIDLFVEEDIAYARRRSRQARAGRGRSTSIALQPAAVAARRTHATALPIRPPTDAGSPARQRLGGPTS